RPLLPQTTRGVRAEDPNREVDHTTDDGDLDREEEQPGDEAENAGENAEEELEHEQARQREEPDHENGAKHSWVLPNEDCSLLRATRKTGFTSSTWVRAKI